jgi:ubiquinone/menaquinone biosynthesis C-methylase UbiE
MTSTSIPQTAWTPSYGDNAAENYERFFVPVIGGPFALDLVNSAGLRPAERVLDVGCGTGTIARLAAERVGPNGRVAGVDVNAAMLPVARSLPSANPIKWYETAAESIPLPDESFDVAFCGLSLQFFADKTAALREIRRVLKPGGRVYISTPRPNAFMDVLDHAIARHVSQEAAAFVHAVFSLNDPGELERLLADAGFTSATTRVNAREVQFPPAREFMWQYISCTPLMTLLPKSGNAQTEALEREVVAGWQRWADGGGLRHEQSCLFSIARK